MCKILRWRPKNNSSHLLLPWLCCFPDSSHSLHSHYCCSHPVSVLLIILLVTIRPAHVITVILIQGPHLPLLWAPCLIRKVLSLQQWMRQQQISCDRKAFNDTRSGSGKKDATLCACLCVLINQRDKLHLHIVVHLAFCENRRSEVCRWMQVCCTQGPISACVMRSIAT